MSPLCLFVFLPEEVACRLKRIFYFPCILCLIIGLLVGVLLPIDLQEDIQPAVPGNAPANFAPPPGASQPADSGSADTSAQAAPLNPEDNFPLLSTACAVNRCLQQQNWSALAAYVHPERGVTFTPYSTVEPRTDLNFSAAQIKSLAQDQTVYSWGFEDGRGDPIQMTAQQYYQRYVYDKDYTQAPEIGIDTIITAGNALENLIQVYSGCRFVDFSFSSSDPVNDGLDWSSLKLVFQMEEGRWYLVGIVHGEWTI